MSFFNRLKTRLRRKMMTRETIYQLGQLSNKELGDIGLSRGDIPFIAKKSAKKRYPL